MLTRLEVSGFKNLMGLAVDFGTFTCVAGENAAGKSNLFDAIELLALLADHPLMDAAQQVRSTAEHRPGDPRDLFWKRDPHSGPIKLTAEMIVPFDVVDDFGQPAQASITFLRYEVHIGYEPSAGARRLGRLLLLTESLRHINLGDAPRHLHFPHHAQKWRREVVRGRRSGTDFISTSGTSRERLFKIHQDGGSRGQPKVASAWRAPATVVSTATQAGDPTILAARREMQSWRRLALEPRAMRANDSYNDAQQIEFNGRHLAGTLYRAALEHDESGDVYARVATRLAALTGLRIDSIRVDADDARETLTLMLRERDNVELPARSLSEGTLRFLALCVMLEDPEVSGLLCMEEPENGIHPANLPAMVDLLRDLAMDTFEPPGPGLAVAPDQGLVARRTCRHRTGRQVGPDRLPLRAGRRPAHVRPGHPTRSGVTLRALFLADGSSDLPLARHLEALCTRLGRPAAVTPFPGELFSSSRVEDRLRAVLAQDPDFDLVVVHRDSEARDANPRYR